jgi:VIT1/CCC1 family predicted Fe2+/Mn2+ transporter
MNATLLLVYFAIWLALAIGTFLFFRGKDPAFKKRWHRRVAVFNVSIIGGMLLLMVALMGHWEATVIFAAAFLYFMWVAVFRTRVCPGCGRLCQPQNLITPEKFCSKCGTALE